MKAKYHQKIKNHYARANFVRNLRLTETPYFKKLPLVAPSLTMNSKEQDSIFESFKRISIQNFNIDF